MHCTHHVMEVLVKYFISRLKPIRLASSSHVLPPQNISISPSGPLGSHGLKCQPFLLTLVPKSQHSSVSKFSLWQKLVVKTTNCYFFFPTNCITFGAFHNTTLLLSYCAVSLHSKPPIFLVSSLKKKNREKSTRNAHTLFSQGFLDQRAIWNLKEIPMERPCSQVSLILGLILSCEPGIELLPPPTAPVFHCLI